MQPIVFILIDYQSIRNRQMSWQKIQDENDYHPLDEKIMEIELNLHEKEQDSSRENQQDSPFSSLQQILGPDDSPISKKTEFQTDKTQQLQNKCESLSRQNVLLTKRIAELQLQIYSQGQSQEESQKITEFIELMQSQISNYKTQFEQYKQKQMQKSNAKQKLINQLRSEILSLTQQNNEISQEYNSLLQNNSELQRINQTLAYQLQSMSKQLLNNTSEPQSSRSYGYAGTQYPQFERQVELQLERLIEKLVYELEFERGQKKRLNEEISQMQENLLELQRQIILKNNRIYTLEIKQLQQNKEHSKIQKASNDQPQDRTIKYSKSSVHLNDRNKAARKEYSALKTFSIKQLFSQAIYLNEIQKFVITSKIIDFYIKKLQANNYSAFRLEDLLICNFTSDNPHLIVIRNDFAALPANGEVSPQKLIDNLVFAIESILGDVLNGKQQRSESEEKLLNLLTEILEQSSVNLSRISSIKRVIDDIVNEYQ